MRRYLPCLFVFPAAVWIYACSSDSSNPGDTVDSGTPDTGTIDHDGSSSTDGGGTDGNVDAGPNANPLPSNLAAASITTVQGVFAEGPIFSNGALYFAAYAAEPPVLVKVDPANANATSNPVVVPPVTARPLGMTIDGKTNSIVRVQSSDTADQSQTGVFRWLADGGTGPAFTPSFDGGVPTWDSPNDIVVRTSDGTMYVTDPGYQKNMAIPDSVVANHIFQITPGGAVIEAASFPDLDRPNGVALDKAQSNLYVSFTAGPNGGKPLVAKYAIGATGSLGAKSSFATLDTGSDPDGIAIDDNGNVYVAETVPNATSGRVEVFKADGTKWGVITVAASANNLTFGGADRKTLYITTPNGVYSIGVNVPGLVQ